MNDKLDSNEQMARAMFGHDLYPEGFKTPPAVGDEQESTKEIQRFRKTLADVQPGGRVRLGDALPPLPPEVDAVRCMIRGEKDLAEACDYYYTAEQMRDYARAALSAQPSPGGQDVLFIEELAELRRLVPSVNQKQALDAAIVALAARQPVGYSGVRICGDERPCINCYSDQGDCLGPAPSQDSTHQPVLQEPVAWISRIRCVGAEYGKEIYGKLPVQSLNPLYYEHIPLYAAPPAQAVDLGQFRRAVRWAVVNAVTEDFKNYAEGLLALIDSQAVGK